MEKALEILNSLTPAQKAELENDMQQLYVTCYAKTKGQIEKLKDVHYADLAEIFELLEISEVVYIIKIFDKQKSADALAELDEDIREGIIENLSEKEIAERIRFR